MVATLAAQFLSALADNALIFAALALVRQRAYPAWTGPLLQEFFVGTYILLAPFVGAYADARAKGAVMLYSNIAKFAGALGMCIGLNPFVCYAAVGAGAAAYSPAKYGILSELSAPEHLVKANGLLEAATIASILLGSILGGALTDWSVGGAIVAITGCYAAAAIATILIPRNHAVSGVVRFSFLGNITTFAAQTVTLLKNADARLALVGTAIFWGGGAALRFLIIAWVPVVLKVLTNRLPGYLTAMVAAGIVVGAGLAARFVPLKAARRALPAGVLIGVGVCFLPLVHHLTQVFVLMAFVGTCSGFFVVPLDALLQQCGERSVGVGASIAIQNMFENMTMLLLMAAYTLAIYRGIHINVIALGCGIFIALSITALALTSKQAAV